MKRTVGFLLGICGILLLALIFFSPYVLHAFHVDTFVQKKVAEALGRDVTCDYVQIRLVPAPTLHLKNVTIVEKPLFDAQELLRVETIGLQLDFFSLLFKRITIDKFIFKNALLTIRERHNRLNLKELLLDQAIQAAQRGSTSNEASPEETTQESPRQAAPDIVISDLALKNIEIVYEKMDAAGALLEKRTAFISYAKAKQVGIGRVISFKCAVAPSKEVNPIELSGTSRIMSFEDILGSLELEGRIQAKNSSIPAFLAALVPENQRVFTEGFLQTDLVVTKEKEGNAITLGGTIRITDGVFSSVIPSPHAYTIESTLDLSWNPVEGIEVRKGIIGTGKSVINFEGKFDSKNKVVNARLYSTQCLFTDIPVLELCGENLPPDSIFSGGCSFDVLLAGDFFQQTIRGRCDISAVDMRFGDYYHKPHGFPLSLELDFAVDSFRTLTGPITLNVGAMIMKGDVRNFDMMRMDGEVSCLTNKFDIAPFVEQMPFLKGMTIAGKAKLLGSLKGSFADPTQQKFSAGATLDTVSLTKDMLEIRNVNATMQCDKRIGEISSFEGMVGTTPLKGWVRIENYMDVPSVRFDVYSPFCDLDELSALLPVVPQTDTVKSSPQKEGERIVGAPQEKPSTEASPKSSDIEPWRRLNAEGAFMVEKLKASGTLFTNVKGVVQGTEGTLSLSNFSAQAWDGTMTGSGSLQLTREPYVFDVKLLGDALSIEKIAETAQGAEAAQEKVITGTLSFEAEASGEGFSFDEIEKNARGKGVVKIKNGELKKIDILQALSTVKQLFKMKTMSTGGTQFKDVTTQLELADGVLKTNDLTMSSSLFAVQGKGLISLRGALNYNLDVLLSPQMAQEFFLNMGADQVVSIPVQITGTIEKPQYAVTGSIVQRVVGNVLQQGLNRLFGVSSNNASQTARETAQPVSSATPTSVSASQPVQSAGSSSDTQPTQEQSSEEVVSDLITMGLDMLLKGSKQSSGSQ